MGRPVSGNQVWRYPRHAVADAGLLNNPIHVELEHNYERRNVLGKRDRDDGACLPGGIGGVFLYVVIVFVPNDFHERRTG